MLNSSQMFIVLSESFVFVVFAACSIWIHNEAVAPFLNVQFIRSFRLTYLLENDKCAPNELIVSACLVVGLFNSRRLLLGILLELLSEQIIISI